MAMSVTTRAAGENEVLEIAGRIVNVESDKFKNRIEEFAQQTKKKVIIDLSGVDFIDSFGLGALVGHHTKLQKQGRDLIIINSDSNPSSYLRRLFEMTSLDKILTIAGSDENL
jgi:anti-anti-sigma factor